jgi:alpha-1,3-rhamnosyl/mannosyltransferase
VSDADRNGLLAMSTAMVFPSRYEGFGAPIIEAMALGAPVISSDATCLPEVVGDAGIVLPPTVEAWAGALDEVTARRDELVAAGAVRVEAFTSARSGEALEQAYRQAAGR